MPIYPSDTNDTVVYNGVDLYIPKDCSCTVFEDSRVFLFGEWYLNGQPIMSGSAAISGAEVSVSTTQPVDPGVTLWFDTSAGYGELKVLQGGSWKTVEDPADSIAANEVEIGVGQPVAAGAELWVDTSSTPENLKAKVAGSWKSINNEVVIGGTEPTDPNIELWVDTATSPPGVVEGYVSPGNAIGVIAVGTVIGGAGISTTLTKITNDLPVTLLTGRRYKINFCIRSFTGSTPPGSMTLVLNDGVTALPAIGSGPLFAFDTNYYDYVNFSWLLDGDGTTKNLNVTSSIAYGSGTITFQTGGSSYFYVEDLGPNVRPAYPLPAPPPDGYVSPGNALGVVAIGSILNNLTGIGTLANGTVVSNPLVYTMSVGRKYVVRANLAATWGSVVNGLYISILRDGVVVFNDGYVQNNTTASSYSNLPINALFDGDGVSHTWTVRVNTSTGTFGFWSENNYLYIEDIGPNVSPALPIPATPPAWTPVTVFTNSWTNFGGTYQPVRYRKIGDIVYVEGAAKHAVAATFNDIFILPIGFRPSKAYQFAVPTWGLDGIVTVSESTGGIASSAPSDARFVGLNLQFSVTP